MPFNINHLTPVLFGANMSLRTGMRLKGMGCKKVLFVYDQGIKKAGIPDKIVANCEALGIKTYFYEDVQADPPDYTVEECAEIGRKAKVDGVVAIGGGSSMDTAKVANLLQTNPPPLSQYLGFGGPPFKQPKKLILIPTTSGTGSEVTNMAVLTDSKTGNKGGPANNMLRATLSIVDPVLTIGMPPSITADTGMDAFCHAAEAVTSGQANPQSDLVGMDSIRLVCEYLPKAVKNGKDLEARTKMSFAAMNAGYAFNDAITHIGHSIGHALGAMYHIPHGNACALAIGEIMEFVASDTPDGIRRVATSMGLNIDGASTEKVGSMVCDAVRKLNKEIGLKTLKDHGLKRDQLDEMAERSLAGPVMFSPKKVDKAALLEILTKAYDA
ncbi:MAG: iron-containing alcohol dehydrogenase [Dehalococcoidales bacterium]|nr:iron-containing alcohol dehydrogenase [Dehalococcoidales bacterium]